MDRLTMMEAFVRVVDAGSFSGAARGWGRSKAVISKYVGGLEAELGVELLRRTTRSLRLTDAGAAYYPRCQQLLGELASLEASLRDDQLAPRGLLRVTAPPGFAEFYLPLMTSEFTERFHEVRLELQLTHRLVDLVAEGIDVAVRITDPRDSTLIARRLAPAPIVAVAAPAYLAQRGTPTLPAQLADHACLVDTNFRDQQRWPFVVGGRQQTVTVNGPFRVNSPSAVRQLAVAGHGIALSPQFLVADDLSAGRLVQLLPGMVALNWSVYAVYPRKRFVSGRVRAYVDHLAHALSRVPALGAT